MVSAIAPDYHVLESGKMDTILAHQRPNLRDIVFQIVALDAEGFIEERALLIPLVASRHWDNLVLKYFSPTVEDSSDRQFAVLIPGEPDVLRFYNVILFIGIQLKNGLSRLDLNYFATP
jgi:hypothetical protein